MYLSDILFYKKTTQIIYNKPVLRIGKKPTCFPDTPESFRAIHNLREHTPTGQTVEGKPLPVYR
jgi:hypothetical protein